jgi:signal transduction histidine kinase
MSSVRNSRRGSFAVSLNVWFAAAVTVLALALFFAAYLLLSASIAQKDREVIRAQLDLYRSWYEDGWLPELSRRFADRADSGREAFFVRVTGPEGAGVFISEPSGSATLDPATLDALGATPQEWTQLPAGGRSGAWLVSTAQLGDGRWLQVGKTTEAQQALLERFRFVAAWALALDLAVGLIAGALLASRALGPVRRLIAAVHRVLATGEMEARIPIRPGPGDELHELTSLFNQMLEKNGALLRGMREALDNVAHDLRTPLTRLHGSAERALAKPPGPADREAVSDALEEAEKVLLLLNTLMDISEAETGLMRLEKTDVPLAALAAEAAALYELVAEDRKITVSIDVPAEIRAFGDRQRLRQALVNLLDNALKYTPAGGAVTIFAESHPGATVLAVRDTGPGIPREESSRIWERLYRGDKSRSARGLGLGLSLVKAIAEAHGGRAEVENAPSGGAVFRVFLPARPESIKPGGR